MQHYIDKMKKKTKTISCIVNIESNRLIIQNATIDDSGYYKCVARNEFSTSEHAEQINVAGKC